MKKFLWFLVGMAIIISIPILLFNREAPLKGVPPQGATPQDVVPKGETPQGIAPQGVTSTRVPSKEPLPKGKEIQKDQGQKPGPVTGLKGNSIKGEAEKYKGPPSNTAGR